MTATDDRAQYDGDRDHLDEVVIHDATVHIEAMDAHNWMVIVSRGSEVYAHFNVQNLIEAEDMVGVPYVIHEPLKVCCEWRDRKNVRHYCTRKHKDSDSYAYHKCDCGAQHEGRR